MFLEGEHRKSGLIKVVAFGEKGLLRGGLSWHSKQPSTGQISSLIAFSPGYFVFKNEKVKVKVKYGFVLYTGLTGSPFYFRIITSYLKMSEMP